MKLIKLLMGLFLCVSSAAFASKNHDVNPMQGGKVTTTKDIDIEFVLKKEDMKVFLRDHGKPVDIKGGTAKVTLLKSGASKEYELKNASDYFQYSGDLGVVAGTKAIVVVRIKEKVFSVRYAFD